MQLLTRTSRPGVRSGGQPAGAKRVFRPPRATADGQGPEQPPAQPQIRVDDPVQTVVAGGRLPSTRRFVGGVLTASAVALGGNLGGVTSWLLSLDGGDLAGRLKLDVLVPVRGLKRCVDEANGFEFQYPAEWLGDQTLVRRAAQRAEAARGLDPPSLQRPRRRDMVEPAVGFGPPGSTGEQNVSVIVAPIAPGFSLESLGTPSEAAQRFLSSTVAPPGSDKTANLISASRRVDASGAVYYQFEYTVQKPGPAGFSRRNVSVLAARDDSLYTLNAQAPESEWDDGAGAAAAAAAVTFRLLPGAPRRLRRGGPV